MKNQWHKSDWRNLPILQQPTYPDIDTYNQALQQLEKLPPLVFAGEVRRLRKRLKDVALGKAFLLQGGDCAECFAEFNADSIRDTLRVLLQMALVLTYGARKPIVKIGRIAGQFAKPRSDNFETQDGVKLPSYRGDNVNGINFNAADRIPDPQRLLTAYYQSAVTMNLLRAFSTGGFADLHKIHRLNLDFIAEHEKQEFFDISSQIKHALDFISACGFTHTAPELRETEVYTSHEALLLGYEEALTRQDSLTGKWYDCSAHMVWIGERTRDPNHAHVRFLSGVHNPIGVKISTKTTQSDVLRLCDTLNPQNVPGRLTFITRMGNGNIPKYLPTLLRAIEREQRRVIWCCDPMHGNTEKLSNGYKTRRFDAILGEVRDFFHTHREEGTYPGGIHLEMTGADVTECLGGLQNIPEERVSDRYHTRCDPRLNATQVLELAHQLAENLNN